ncbi:MAG: His/Gly/Thr/Pro-type tRNA ligase C-terminal domain-containing protein, partial [Acidimicrobiia bacterium]
IGAHLDTLGARVRDAKMQKVPYVLVVGDSDVDHDTVGLNVRGSERPERDVAVDDFVARLRDVVETRGNL